jgi:hypothetical protein
MDKVSNWVRTTISKDGMRTISKKKAFYPGQSNKGKTRKRPILKTTSLKANNAKTQIRMLQRFIAISLK